MPTSEKASPVNWQRWQPKNFLDDFITEAPLESIDTNTEPSSDALSQAELTRLRQQAEQQGRAEGHQRGFEEGKLQGYEAGFSEGKQAGFDAGQSESLTQQLASTERLTQLMTALASTLDNLHNIIPSRLVQHALSATRALLGQHVRVDDTVLLETIKALLQQDTLLNGDIHLMVSTEDAACVKQHFGETLSALGWALKDDPQMLPGGCRLTSEEGEFDATLDSRWQALCQLSREDLA